METNGSIARHFLFPGALFAHHDEHLVTTVLGSCVAVCLLDPANGIGGINHYMLPLWNGEGLPTPKYGNIAIERLVKKMLEFGLREEKLVAKIFGGANVLAAGPGIYSVGERNILLARQLLREHDIRVISEDVGGIRGRKVIFNTMSGEILVGKMKSSSN